MDNVVTGRNENLKKVRLILLLIILLILTGCSNRDVIKHTYFRKGESDLWKVYYQEKSVVTIKTIDGKLNYDSNTDATFTAVYKKRLSDLKNVKKIVIGYEAGSSGSTLTEENDGEGPSSRAFILHSSDGLVGNEDGVVNATISIDGETETFELKNNK